MPAAYVEVKDATGKESIGTYLVALQLNDFSALTGGRHAISRNKLKLPGKAMRYTPISTRLQRLPSHVEGRPTNQLQRNRPLLETIHRSLPLPLPMDANH